MSEIKLTKKQTKKLNDNKNSRLQTQSYNVPLSSPSWCQITQLPSRGTLNEKR